MRGEVRYFEWLAGEYRGVVTTLTSMYKDGDNVIYEFADGESMDEQYISPITNRKNDLVGKFMVEVDTPHNLWTFEEVRGVRVDLGNGQYEQAPPLNDIIRAPKNDGGDIADSDLGKLKMIAPKNEVRPRALPRYSDYGVVETPKPITPKKKVVEEVVETPKEVVKEHVDVSYEPTSVNEQYTQREMSDNTSRISAEVVKQPSAKQNTESSHPVDILVNKAKKTEQDVEIVLKMRLPSKKLFDFVCEDFDDGAEVFIENVVHDLSVDAIYDSIRTALMEAYTSFEGDVNYEVPTEL